MRGKRVEIDRMIIDMANSSGKPKPCPHGTFFGKTYGDRCQFDKIKSNADSR